MCIVITLRIIYVYGHQLPYNEGFVVRNTRTYASWMTRAVFTGETTYLRYPSCVRIAIYTVNSVDMRRFCSHKYFLESDIATVIIFYRDDGILILSSYVRYTIYHTLLRDYSILFYSRISLWSIGRQLEIYTEIHTHARAQYYGHLVLKKP